MGDDPNKKEWKGKRILKKALRRSSKSSTSSQDAPPSAPKGTGERALVIRDDTGQESTTNTSTAAGAAETKHKNSVDIQETRNTIHEHPPAPPPPTPPPPATSDNEASAEQPSTSKKNLKRVGFIVTSALYLPLPTAPF